MGKFIDLTGQKFGRWTVLEFAGVKEVGKDKVKKGFWKCQCQCEKHTVRDVPSDSLKGGNSKSCGCLKVEEVVRRSTKHGFARRGENATSIYYVWYEIKARCLNPNCSSYKNYGGRGIKVCGEWVDSFIAFKDWAFANGYEIGLTIDRINNDGDYEPNNCRWVDLKTQANNTRNCRYIEINGERKTIAQWCEIYGIDSSLVYSRIDAYKWNPVDAITTPPKKKGANPIKPVIAVDCNGNIKRFKSSFDASQELGVITASIRSACRKQRKNFHGYDWYYECEYHQTTA